VNFGNNYIKLEDVCSFIRGVTYSKNDESGNSDGIGILRSNNVDFLNNKINFRNLRFISDKIKLKEEQRLKKNDILMCIANGSKELVGKVGFCYTDSKYYAGGFMSIIRPFQTKINSHYLFINLFSEKFKNYSRTKNQGTNIRNITFNGIKDFAFPLPDIEIQNYISSLFEFIETTIDQVDNQGQNLLNLKKTLIDVLVNETPVWGNLVKEDNYVKSNYGNIAKCIEEHDKQKKEVQRFIGLEHIETENLTISTWGNIADGTTFTKRFSEGDVLFGKRRAYLKKVAVADFDGICSSDILVLRANKNYILPELLPFYLSSENFIQHAINTSAGSLSPRTKWKDLSGFKVGLPNLDIQKKIVEVFLQIQSTLKEINAQKTTLKNLKHKLLNEILG